MLGGLRPWPNGLGLGPALFGKTCTHHKLTRIDHMFSFLHCILFEVIIDRYELYHVSKILRLYIFFIYKFSTKRNYSLTI